MSVQDTKVAAIELIIDQNENGQVAANVPVRWKISPEMVQRLAEKGVEPYMLLVVTADEQEMDRHLLPLKAGMTYLQLRRPGINTIHATIVWRREGEPKVRDAVFEKDDYGRYKFMLCGNYLPGAREIEARRDEIDRLLRECDYNDAPKLSAEQEELRQRRRELYRDGVYVRGLYDHYTIIERTPEGDSVNVDVPEEMFAKPPGWLMSKLATLYGARFWRRPGWRDECDVRRRALFTFFTLPFVAVIGVIIGGALAFCWVLFKLIAVLSTAVLLFFGKRGLNYSVIYEWDNFDLTDIWYHAKPSYWLYKKVTIVRKNEWHPEREYSEVKYVKRNPFFTWVNPPMVIGYVLVYLAYATITGREVSVGNGASFIVPLFAVGGISALVDLYQKRQPASKPVVVTQEQRSRLEHELSSLTSDGHASLDDLPKEKRTVRLRYLHLKAAVCKPFAR